VESVQPIVGLAGMAAPARFTAVAIGASAGGVAALTEILAALPARLPAAVLIVQHLDPRRKSMLPSVLGRHSALRIKEAEEGDRLQPGTVYIAPADRHLLVSDDHVTLSGSALVNFSRPSIDLLFVSVAETFGPRAIGVILTGAGVDGAGGLAAIKRHGGVTIVQDPRGAEHRRMPDAARLTGCADRTVPLKEIAATLTGLVWRELEATTP
jgi:two-component system, chemotaxis family, protein-glutamate methylesterase/glutaminase